MKRWFSCLWLGFIYPGMVLGQQCTVEDVQKQISHLYRIIDFPLDDNKLHRMAVEDTIASNQLLAGLLNGHRAYMGYLSANYSLVRTSAPAILKPGIPLKQANALLDQTYANDAVFNRHFLTLACYYLRSQGIRIKQYTPPARVAITMPALMTMAARFFERLETAPDGRIRWHLNLSDLAGANYDPTAQNQPLIEAFCSEAVMNWSYSWGWDTVQDEPEFYAKAQSLTERMAQFTSADEQRQVVRPAMRALISRSKVLEKVLLAEYQRSQDWLAFTLVH